MKARQVWVERSGGSEVMILRETDLRPPTVLLR